MNALIVIELYISDDASESRSALNVVTEVCQRLGELCEYTVVDVQKDPQAAVQAGIFVTPTLIRREPTPEKRIIGRLDDHEQLLITLGIDKHYLAGSEVE